MPTINENVRTREWSGLRARRAFEYQGPASYNSTSGDKIKPGDAFLGKEIEVVSGAQVALDAAGANPRLVVFVRQTDPAEGVVARWFVPNTGSEVANATDLSAYKLQLEVAGGG